MKPKSNAKLEPISVTLPQDDEWKEYFPRFAYAMKSCSFWDRLRKGKLIKGEYVVVPDEQIINEDFQGLPSYRANIRITDYELATLMFGGEPTYEMLAEVDKFMKRRDDVVKCEYTNGRGGCIDECCIWLEDGSMTTIDGVRVRFIALLPPFEYVACLELWKHFERTQCNPTTNEIKPLFEVFKKSNEHNRKH
jgi:hypothetical protein